MVVPRAPKTVEEASRSFRPLSAESLLGYWQLQWLESGRWPGYEAKSKFPSQLVLTVLAANLMAYMLMTVRVSQPFRATLRLGDQ